MTDMQREILDEYLITYDYYAMRINQMDERIAAISEQERYKEKVECLCCLAGMSVHKSLCHIVETGDFSRLPKHHLIQLTLVQCRVKIQAARA